jgi:hypothetical protein
MTSACGVVARLMMLASIASALQAQSAAKEPISDNSFLIEESYNQDPGVVQHISTLARTFNQRGWAYTFTQEWPVPGRTHQLSYTIPLLNAGSVTGVGDVMLNYRYQAVEDDERGIAFSPRVSMSVPTGDYKKLFGVGNIGWQVSLPVSKTLGESFVSHTNAGATWWPSARMAGDGASISAVNLGQSLVWLMTPRFNFMLESIWSRTTTRAHGANTSSESAFISPGIRWGYDFPSGLQIVPGVAVPIGVGPSRGTRQLFLYLSFEHPFTEAARPHPK